MGVTDGLLTGWLERPDPSRGMRFMTDTMSWQRYTYPELAELVNGAAAAFLDAGVARGQVVPVLVPPSPEFVAAFFGLLAIGAIPTVLPLLPALGGRDDHAAYLIGIAAELRPRFAVANAANGAALEAAVASTGSELVRLEASFTARSSAVRRKPSELAVVQYTSGSRDRPRGLRITWRNLEANLRMVQDWLKLERYAAVSWLPLYHDMGLVGGLLTPTTAQAEHAVMRPRQFVLATADWLAEYGKAPYAHMVMPNFGFERVVNRVRPEDLQGLDFTNLTSVITGAERVNPAVLSAFVRLLAPFGFDGRALMPAYGLAEATLAVTGVAKRERPTLVRVAGLAGDLGNPVTVLQEATGGVDTVADPDQWHVGCGHPLPGLTVELIDGEGNRLPESRLGEIVTRGPSIAEGYVRAGADDPTRFADGWLYTGDAGFQHRGQVYVIGRLGDSVKVRGQRVFVEDVELKLAGITSAGGRRRLTVVAGMDGAMPTLLVLAEFDLADQLDVIAGVVRGFVGDAARVLVVRLPRGGIPLTSSGKPRRRAAWLRYLKGELPGEELLASTGPWPRRDVRAEVQGGSEPGWTPRSEGTGRQ